MTDRQRDPYPHKRFCLTCFALAAKHIFLYFVNDACGCCGFLTLWRALCRCQSAFLSTSLVELFCSKFAGTRSCYQRCLVSFQPVADCQQSLIESGPLLAKYGCIPRLRASKMLHKSSMFVLIRSALTHVDSVMKQ